MHTFKKGADVTVLNTRFDGTIIVEGQARILQPIKDIDEQYLVRFLRDGTPSLGEEYERFVDPLAQADPESYVAQLNSGMENCQWLGCDPSGIKRVWGDTYEECRAVVLEYVRGRPDTGPVSGWLIEQG